MEFAQVFEMFSGIVGGLCIFLLGMSYMSSGMQAIAGNRLRRMIAAVTDNRIKACATGAAVTCLIQSSSVTAVMAISMVNVGLMTLQQSIGVLLGADIGTTITAWIVALHVTKHGLIILGISGFFYLFSKNERVKFASMFFLGIGLIFFGLAVMKDGMSPLRESAEFIKLFSRFNPSTYWGLTQCVMIGALTTAVMQSSSATIAITILLANSEVISFDTAVALVLGQNIGTTITAYLAALGTSTSSKRTAYAHILIKAIGVAVIFPVFYFYMSFLNKIMPGALANDIGKQIALSHTIFNGFIVLLFLPVTGLFCKLLIKLVPGQPEKDVPRLIYLDVGLAQTPSIAIQESRNAILTMRDSVDKMLMWLGTKLETRGDDQDLTKKLLCREDILDLMQKEILEFISKIMQKNLPFEVIFECRQQLRIASEYESIGDYIITLMELKDRLKELESDTAANDIQNIKRLHLKICHYLSTVGVAFAANDKKILTQSTTENNQIISLVDQYRDEHLLQIEHAETAPEQTLIIVDMLQSYKKIRSHTLNIAEAIAGQK